MKMKGLLRIGIKFYTVSAMQTTKITDEISIVGGRMGMARTMYKIFRRRKNILLVFMKILILSMLMIQIS